MEEIRKYYKDLEGRYDYLNTPENLRSPYMQARLDECRLAMAHVLAILVKNIGK